MKYSNISDRAARWHAKRIIKDKKAIDKEIRQLNNLSYRMMALGVAAHQLNSERERRILDLERKRYLHPDIKTDNLYKRPSRLEQTLQKLVAVGIGAGFAIASGAAVMHQKDDHKISQDQYHIHSPEKDIEYKIANHSIKYQSEPTPINPDVPQKIASTTDKNVSMLRPSIDGQDVFYERVEAVYSNDGTTLKGYNLDLRAKDINTGSDTSVDDYYGFGYAVNSKYIVTKSVSGGEPIQIFDKDTHSLVKSINYGNYVYQVYLDKIQKDNLMVQRINSNNQMEFVNYNITTGESHVIKTISYSSGGYEVVSLLNKISNDRVVIEDYINNKFIAIDPSGGEVNVGHGNGLCMGLQNDLVFTQLNNNHFAITHIDGGYEEYYFPHQVYNCEIIDSNTLSYQYNSSGFTRFGMFFLSSEKAFNYPISGSVGGYESKFQDNHLVWAFINNKEKGIYYKDLTNILNQWDQAGKNHQITAADLNLSSTTLLDYNGKEPIQFILDAMVGTDRDGKFDISKELFTLTTPDSVSSAKLVLSDPDSSHIEVYDLQNTGSNPGQKVFGNYIEVETDSTLVIYLKNLADNLMSNTDPATAGLKATLSGSLDVILASEWQGKEVRAVILDGKIIDLPNHYKLTKVNDAEAWNTKTEEFRVHSPVDINVEHNGRIINYDNNVVYSGPDSEPEWVIIFNPQGKYTAELTGTDNGDYDYFHFAVNNNVITEQDIKLDVPIEDGEIHINGEPQSSLEQILSGDFSSSLLMVPILGAGGAVLGYMGYRKRKTIKRFFDGRLNRKGKDNDGRYTSERHTHQSEKQNYSSRSAIDNEIAALNSRLAEIDTEEQRGNSISQKRDELARLERMQEAQKKRAELDALQSQLAEAKRQELAELEALKWQQDQQSQQYYHRPTQRRSQVPSQQHRPPHHRRPDHQRRRRTQQNPNRQWQGDNWDTEWDY